MLQIEFSNNFNGFGNGKQQGEYYYAQAMRRTRFGATPAWGIAELASSVDLSGLSVVHWFAQAVISGNNYQLALNDAGKLFGSQNLGAWAVKNTPNGSYPGFGGGLIVDQKGRVLYAGKRYLGMSSDLSSFTDNWKDFGSDISPTTQWQPMDAYEDAVLILRNNKVCRLNGDDSFNDETNYAFNMPSGFVGRAIKSGPRGVLMGFNAASRAVLVLWDNLSDRSITPWIWKAGQIQAIVPLEESEEWLVITNRAVLLTNGYTAKSLTDLPDADVYGNNFSVYPSGAWVVDNKLLIAQRSQNFNRIKPGLMVLDLDTLTWEYAPMSNGATYETLPSAIGVDKDSNAYIAYSDSFLSKTYIGGIGQADPTQAVFITAALGQGLNEKVTEAVKLDLGIQTNNRTYKAMTFTVSVKLYNFKRQLWTYGQTNGASANATTLRVDGSVSTSNKAQKGDEVTILEGLNAGQIRHITNITNQGTNTETWTLDRALPNNTENTVFLSIQPFQQVARKRITNATELRDLLFNGKNKIKGRKFLTKVVIESASVLPELHGSALIYDDTGAING